MSWVIWITGLSGSGKSTVASAVKEKVSDVVILRMDVLRKIVTPAPSYSEEEREHVYRAIVYTAKTLQALGHKVIIDATGNRSAWRELARSLIPGFFEVYLECPLETGMERERTRTDTHAAPSGIYEKGRAGSPVPGLSVPYEIPEKPDLAINTEKVLPASAADKIIDMLQRYGSR
jgi:adenylylsulfate kinase